MTNPRTGPAAPRLRSTEISVGDIMVGKPIACPPDTAIAEAARMMAERRVSSILVREGGDVVGIWTEHDALGHDLEHEEALDIPIREVMSSPVTTIDRHASINDAALRFKQMGLRHFVVVDGDARAVGLITQSDVVFSHGVEWFMRLQPVEAVLDGVPPVAGAEERVSAVARRLHDAHGDAIVIRDPEGVLGILTERDVVRYIAGRQDDCAAWEIASRPLQTVRPEDSLFNARNLMIERGFRHLGVVDAGQNLVGLIGFNDILSSIEHGYVEELELALAERDSALRASEERYRALVERSPDAIAVHRNGELLFVNPAGVELLGASAPDELIGASLADFIADDEPDRRLRLVCTDTGHKSVETRLRPRGRDEMEAELSASPITYGEQEAWQVVLRDITERKHLEEELRRLATTDQLTGIHNRPHFESALNNAISEAGRYGRGFALLMFDIDHFKRINDALGHDEGDRILQHVVACLARRLRESDMFCRWGGEEFVILAPEIDDEGAERLAQKLLATLRESVETEATGPVTASFGVAVYRDGEARGQLFKRLDEALYAAKRNGRDRVELAD